LGELAKDCVALIIVVDEKKNINDYRNRFLNILKSKVAEGKCCVRLYYTTILYWHSGCCNDGSCRKKTKEEEDFVYLDINDGHFDVEKLRKRLPPPKPDATHKGSEHSGHESYYSIGSWSSDNNSVQSKFSRMDSNASCTSSTPLVDKIVI
jgi:hypothetical protein